jgi:hypothetical protein
MIRDEVQGVDCEENCIEMRWKMLRFHASSVLK